ncbi:MAG TPA: hypothetical protein VK689_11840 [Armatimonadota bacterium]|nr:hypothetical protein [Armatimonadota bacterium]
MQSTETRRSEPDPDYNFAHFRTRHLLYDVTGTLERRGIQPGETAPDFELPLATGGTLRLSDLAGRPVLLRFGSVT